MALDLRDRALGVGNRVVTAVGVVAGVLVAAGQYLALVPEPFRSSKWYAVAAALVALGAALKLPGKKDVAAASTTVGLALLAAGALFASSAARADEAVPAPAPEVIPAPPVAATLLCFDEARLYCVRPGVALTGAAYDFQTRSVARNVTFSGLVEITLGHRLAALAGGGLQSGEAQGIAVQGGLEYLPASVGVLFSHLVVGDRNSDSLAAGVILRF